MALSPRAAPALLQCRRPRQDEPARPLCPSPPGARAGTRRAGQSLLALRQALYGLPDGQPGRATVLAVLGGVFRPQGPDPAPAVECGTMGPGRRSLPLYFFF